MAAHSKRNRDPAAPDTPAPPAISEFQFALPVDLDAPGRIDVDPAALKDGFADMLVGVMAEANERHRAGDLDGAAALYGRALELAPDHAHALHHLGVIAHQKGDYRRATALIGRAVESMPENAGAFSNLGAAWHALGNLKEAEASFRRATELRPDLAEAQSNLATVLNDLGRRDEAVAAYREALRVAPHTPRFVKRLGDLYLEHGQLDDAIEWFGRFLAMADDDGEVNSNLGYALERLDRLEDAERHYRRAAALCVDSPEINHNLAALLVRLGRGDEAETFLNRALSADPERWRNLEVLAGSFVNRRQADRAIPIYRQLLLAQPDDAKLHNDYGVALCSAGRFGEAEPLMKRAVALQPDYVEALSNLGSNRMSQGRRAEAIDDFKRAIALRPRQLEPHINLCLALSQEGRHDEAYLYAQATVNLETYRPCHSSNPHKVFRAVCDFDAIEALGDLWEVNEQSKAADFSANFLEMLVFADSEDEIGRLSRLHRRWYREVVKPSIREKLPPLDLAGRRGKIRIGIMSSDLRRHSVAKFVLPVIEHYDRDRFEIYCYSPNEDPRDDVQARIRGLVKEFRVLSNRSDREFAEAIRADEIDILFELNGFTRDTKIKVLAYKPAPVQIYWLGYPFTTGIEEIDYILLDPKLKPADDSWLVEKPLLMPESWVCFGETAMEPIGETLPVERNGVVTFGSLNNPYKLTRRTIALWSRVMAAVPESRFLYVRPECTSFMLVANLTKEFERNGIARDRLFFVNNRATALSHLSYYDEIDVTLDTWPLTGGTTTCDTLWMGTPVVTRVGPSLHQRLSYSMLKTLGLDGLCVASEDDYVSTAVALATDLDSLRLLRRELRRSVQESALGRAEDFARDFCALMSGLVERHGLR